MADEVAAPTTTAELASVDGSMMPAQEATIPATDEGLLRGDGAFEVIRVYDGRAFALTDHLDRLERSAANLRLDDVPRSELESEIPELLEERGGAEFDGCLRVVLTRGGHRLLLTEPLPAAPERGFDEALLVTPHGRVLEAPTSSLFWVDPAGALNTPPLSEHILASITRQRVMEVADVSERPCTMEDLREAGEAFLASTTREAQSIAAIEDLELPEGERTGRVRTALHARIEEELAAS